MKIAIRHQLSLEVGPGVTRSVQHLLLTPQTGSTQTVESWAIEMPGIDGASRFVDGFGNRAALVTQVRPEAELAITVTGTVNTIDRNGVVGRPAGEPPPALYRRQTASTKPIGAVLSKFRSAARSGPDRIPLLHALMARVGEVVGGDTAAEATQSQSQGGEEGAQQSQSQATSPAPRPDASAFALAFIGAARALDIPARYVTGYFSDPDDGAARFHAWAEAWDDGLGWIAFDPSQNYCPTERHIRVAVGLDAISTVPVRAVPVTGEPRVVAVSIEPAQ